MGDGYTTPCHPGPPASPHYPRPLPDLWRERNRGSTKRKFLYAQVMFKALEKAGLQGGETNKSRVVRQRHIHAPGIQQEPHTFTPPRSHSLNLSEFVDGSNSTFR